MEERAVWSFYAALLFCGFTFISSFAALSVFLLRRFYECGVLHKKKKFFGGFHLSLIEATFSKKRGNFFPWVKVKCIHIYTGL